MSNNTEKAAAPVEETFVADSEPLKAVIPSGTVLSGTTYSNEPWFNVWLPQTFAGAVSGGYAKPSLSGNGWAGQNNTGFVFQNDQYNTTNRGF
jgi:hypothetical protein